jgi:hypothetical protein
VSEVTIRFHGGPLDGRRWRRIGGQKLGETIEQPHLVRYGEWEKAVYRRRGSHSGELHYHWEGWKR